jgi:tRNA dimethylallyltransferase
MSLPDTTTTTNKTLVVITGPTGSGKTSLAIELARRLKCEIISADSRQLFHEIPIGTAAPTPAELAAVKHHMVGCLDLGDYYSAAQFEQDALALLNTMFATNQYAVMCGGSMMYVDAVTRGIDDLPTISEAVRTEAYRILNEEGIEAVKQRLQTLDPTYLQQVDINNHKRLVHALEICMEAGVPYSSLRTGKSKPRPFKSIKFAFNYNRDELFSRINARVDAMVANGLLDEAKRVYHLRHLNSLNTVGYKEMFAYLDGTWDFETAVARMAKNTRVYAKKQLTWLHRDADVIWLDPHSNDVVADVMQHLV